MVEAVSSDVSVGLYELGRGEEFVDVEAVRLEPSRFAPLRHALRGAPDPISRTDPKATWQPIFDS